MRTAPPRHAPANSSDGAPHRPRALTVFAAAFLAGAAAAVGVNRVLDVRLAQLKPRVESESIFVALRSLPQGSPVTVWDVALRDWPKAMLPGTALRAQDSFAGMVLKHPLREGQPLLSVQLAPADTGRSPADPTAAAAAPAFVHLQTPATAPVTTTDLWTPAEPARSQPPAPQPPAPQPTPVTAVPEAERPAEPSDSLPATKPVSVPSVAGPTTPATEPAGVPAAQPSADPTRVPGAAGANDAAVAPQEIATPESRPQAVGPEPQAAGLTAVTEPQQPVANPTEPFVAPATVAEDQPEQTADPTAMADGLPTPADPDVNTPASEPQPAVVESVVAPPATASLPPAPGSQRSDAEAPRPTYPRYLVVPEKIALQADRSFAAPAQADPQPSTPAQAQGPTQAPAQAQTAAVRQQQPGDTAAVRPLPSTASGGSATARGQVSPGNPGPRQSRQPAPPRRGSTPPAETKPRIGATMFPNLSNGLESLEGRMQRQPGSQSTQR